MKILTIAACPFPAPRGTPIRIERMAEALARRGHEVHVATYHFGDGQPSPLLHLHRIAGPARYHRSMPGPTWTKLVRLDPRLTRTVRRLLGDPYDVVHAHHVEGLLCAWRARGQRRVPVVFDAHTLLESELPAYGRIGGPMLRWVGRQLDRALPPLADHVIAVSDEIREQLLRLGRITPASVTVIGNGVETEQFPVNDARPANAVVAFAGNFAPYQGIDLLLQGFARLAARRPDARLRLLGTDDFAPWQGLVKRLGIEAQVQIVRLAFRELPAALAEASVLVSPRTECSGLPQKLLNYMASGVPVVAFAGSAKLNEHGRTGLVVRNGDTDALAQAMAQVIDDPALGRSLGRAAREVVLAGHSWDQVAQRVEQVFRAVTR